MNIKHLVTKVTFSLVRTFLSSRYNVTLIGTDKINKDGPKLFLPNHQAIVDPVLLVSQIYRFSSAVPVVTEGYFNLPIIKSIFTFWGAIPIADLESGSRDTAVLDEITLKTRDCFHKGENIVLYPSGQLSGQGFEKIFNKQSAWKIVSTLPEDVTVIGVRISGLWGSHWSKAWNGKSPNFGIILLRSIGLVLANLLFFAPKRKVTIEFTDITQECLRKAKEGKNAFNVSLESYYNSKGEELVHFIPHHFFAPKSNRQLPSQINGSVADMLGKHTALTMDDVPLATFDKIVQIAAKILNCKPNTILLESNLMLDLGCDSLNLVEIITGMELAFPKVNIPEITSIRTISDLCLSTMGLFDPVIIMKEQHFTEPRRNKSRIVIDPSKDIVTLFLEKVEQAPNEWFTYDEMLGSTKRRDFLLKALVISEIIRQKTTSEYVGILLPALQSSTLLILSTYLAGKKPVMLNWTVGSKILEHCIETAQLEIILSAGKFVKKIEDQLPTSIQNKLVLLEEEVKNIGTGLKIRSLFYSRFPRLKIKPIDTDTTAVILFTSGSEDLPKAVPLTHKNIVSDLSSVFRSVPLEDDLVFVGFLPPFHSFGFTVLSIFPLTTAIRIGYSPDPTDGKSIARLIKHIGGNVLLGSPSFLKIVLSNGAKSDFASIKYAISGAEAMPASILHLFEELTTNAKLLEGYGITECSPILTINPMDKQKSNSVGQFISGIKGIIVGLESNKILKPNEEGMIYAAGDNIFNGYINHNSNPFEIIDGERYYKTGDLGYLDQEGFLFITGRLKRFIKIGGEMISLPFIEKILVEKYGNTELPSVAIEGSDKIQPPTINLFTTLGLDLEEVNRFLLQNGVSPLAKIKRIVSLPELPLLGSGKIDYKELKKLIEI